MTTMPATTSFVNHCTLHWFFFESNPPSRLAVLNWEPPHSSLITFQTKPSSKLPTLHCWNPRTPNLKTKLDLLLLVSQAKIQLPTQWHSRQKSQIQKKHTSSYAIGWLDEHRGNYEGCTISRLVGKGIETGTSVMQSYPARALARRLQVDWARDPRKGPRVLMSLRVDFEPMG